MFRPVDGATSRLGILMVLLCLWGTCVVAQEPSRLPADGDQESESTGADSEIDDEILDLDIDQLGKVDVVVPSFDVEVTSVTRRESTVGKSPAAIFVITQAMIRRSGATSIPEVLRMAPGVQVAKIDSNKWAITARGFNSRFANKLLVMIDGRSVYTPLFSGVYWDVQDTLLQDIDRIEVIRGPGGTLWGANAVNGVINIITKKARDTQGTLVTSGGGTEERALNGFRYGGTIGSIGSDFHYRIYGKHFERDKGFDSAGAHDDWRQKRVGFRADWSLDSCHVDTFTLQGDYFDGESGSSSSIPSLTPPFTSQFLPNDQFVSGVNVLGRWVHKFDDESDFAFQAYYDKTKRLAASLDQEIDVFDLDFSHRFRLSERHGITWGAHYRHVSDRLGFPAAFLALDPANRQTKLVSTFIQDEITLIEDTLNLTIGSKLEHNDFSGFEYQPSGRLLWTIDEKNVAWAAVSRAVRTPSRVDDDFRLLVGINPVPPIFISSSGNRNVDAEDVMAYEVGYRSQPTDRFSWDVAAFYNDYNNLIVNSARPPIFPPPMFIIPFVNSNGMEGETYGAEFSASYQISDCWRVFGSYSFLQMQIHTFAAADEDEAEEIEEASPHNQVYLQSSWDLPSGFEFDVIGRYVDSLPAFNIANYITLDLRLGYRPNDAWDFPSSGKTCWRGTDSNSTAI